MAASNQIPSVILGSMTAALQVTDTYIHAAQKADFVAEGAEGAQNVAHVPQNVQAVPEGAQGAQAVAQVPEDAQPLSQQILASIDSQLRRMAIRLDSVEDRMMKSVSVFDRRWIKRRSPL